MSLANPPRDADRATRRADESRYRRALPPGPLLFSIRDVTDTLNCSRAQVNRLLATGKIRAVKLGSRTLIPADSLRQFVEGLPPASIRAAA